MLLPPTCCVVVFDGVVVVVIVVVVVLVPVVIVVSVVVVVTVDEDTATEFGLSDESWLFTDDEVGGSDVKEGTGAGVTTVPVIDVVIVVADASLRSPEMEAGGEGEQEEEPVVEGVVAP